MKKLLICTTVALFFINCNQKKENKLENNPETIPTETIQENVSVPEEPFKEMDFTKLNEKLKNDASLKSVDQVADFLVKSFYIGEEGIKKNVKINDKSNAKFELIIIYDSIPDDSIKSEQLIFDVTNENNLWKINYFKKNWKCQKNRGNSQWNIDICS